MSWQNYKKTFRTEGDLFDFARSGDLRGLANLLSGEESLEIDAVNHRGYSALMLAVYNGEKDFCEALLRCGANVNSVDGVGNTVLMAAAFKGQVGIVELLLQFNADISLKNKTNMNVRDWANMFGRTDVLSYLDSHYPSQIASSKFKNMLRFIKLGILLIQSKFK
ncbi:ankyrin repeat domain-containing protein [Psychromonas algicola]|uniref:ankyrin repeat domain-containing protein n=1 Tax=Psychromonas algicola TaxID=2555642 RepID=UPI00106896E9|nr:ankyrin repeat domain-containing protein [Psychromonas sp. RZ5]TEW44770.1 ankyrin repeat domain-containing protein [Psychromonas sp. RZ5]